MKLLQRAGQIYQYYLDKTVPHLIVRWVSVVLLAVFYAIRVFTLQGWYIVTYALGIYMLNLFISFLTPKIDPALQQLEDDTDPDGPTLPTRSGDEFRPFMRRLPEFKFWHSTTKAFVIATVCTFFDALNIPVFWPILVMYFCILFFVTMKKQIRHMIKFRYIPFTHGKATYKGKEESGVAPAARH